MKFSVFLGLLSFIGHAVALSCYHCDDVATCEMWHEMPCEGETQQGYDWYCGEYWDENKKFTHGTDEVNKPSVIVRPPGVLKTVNCSEWKAAECVNATDVRLPDGWRACFCDSDFCNSAEPLGCNSAEQLGSHSRLPLLFLVLIASCKHLLFN
ncbi:unnamed protein product [Darwinula stevensoni]|uniref:Protein quiver n=1 Tax=Darwinula stevensoni TaxID=69355 RepID=A0A7R9ACC2_9CRUS|nr:unnamed protein product [Darwinula stevensoni]CAG0900177.1 unnamed protein product [Darwinula stevensoni]